MSCCEPIINTIASKSGVLYITVLLIAEKNEEVCYLTSDLFNDSLRVFKNNRTI